MLPLRGKLVAVLVAAVTTTVAACAGAAETGPAWRVAAAPGTSPPPGAPATDEILDYRCWIKVPDRWVGPAGNLWAESVTVTVPWSGGGAHTVFVNGRAIGSAGRFPPDAVPAPAGEHRYKVPVGVLERGRWNPLVIRVHRMPPAAAPSIQSYFLECLLEGGWEIAPATAETATAGKVPEGSTRPRVERPERAAFADFHEASRVLAPAERLMPGERLDPGASHRALTTADDLAVDLVLHEPEVAQPTHLSFDARGRLWVAQYRQYPYPAGLRMVSRDKYYRSTYDREPPPPPGHAPGKSRISVHEDTDGDGRFDRHHVFIDGLNLANAALPGEGGVWVMQTPYLLFYPDADGDDTPDGDPVVHLAGFGFEDAHSVANGLRWGPDGWIYGGQGSTTTCRVRRPGADPPGAPGVYFEGCMVWRYHPRTRAFEIFAQGGGNVFGLEFDAGGRLFSGHNGGGTRGWHYVQNGHYLKQGNNPGKFGPPSHPHAYGELPMMEASASIPRFSHNLIVCEGAALPPRLDGKILSADPLHRRLILSARRPRGATFQTSDESFPLASSDKAFRPVYLTHGPDGAIYVADFYEHYIAHGQHYQSQIDPSTGRVYRLRAAGPRPGTGGHDLSRLTIVELIALLEHPNKWHRQTAVRLIGERARSGGAGVAQNAAERLRDWVREHPGQPALDGLWALYQAGGLDPGTALQTLAHPHPGVRAWTVRLLGDHGGEIPPAVMEALPAAARAEVDPEVRGQFASTAQRLPPGQALQLLGALLERGEDAADPYLPHLYWWALEKAATASPEAVLGWFEDSAERWSRPVVEGHLLPRLMRRFASGGSRAGLRACARLLGAAPGPRQRARLVEGFAQAFEGRPLPPLPEALAAALDAAGQLPLVLRLRRGDLDALEEALALVRDTAADPTRRARVIQALGETAHPLARHSLVTQLQSPDRPAIHRAALAALGSFSEPEVGRAALAAYPALAPEVQPAALHLLASRSHWALQLLDAVEAGTVPRGDLIPDPARQLSESPHEAVARRALKLLPAPSTPVETDAAQARRETTAGVRVALAAGPGNTYRGEPLFAARCAACHRLFFKGGAVGPDLTAYQRDDLESLLHAIVDPGADIREGYAFVHVTTRDRRTLGGFLADEDATTIVLRTPDGTDVTLPREAVTEVRPAGRSLMPENLLAGLTDQQLRDLFAYLRSPQPFTR